MHRTRWGRQRLVFAAALVAASPSLASPPSIVAAESVYGDVARQIAGPDAVVGSVLNNPAQDPHFFEVGAAQARAVADAHITIANGASYDGWMERLLSASPRPARISLDVATLLGRHAGENPHLWNDPAAMPALARALAGALTRQDPARARFYAGNLRIFLASLAPLTAQLAALRTRYRGTQIAAAEPVLGPMTEALGLVVLHPHFGLSVMNETEPRPSDMAGMEDDLRSGRARLLLTNQQVGGTLVDRLRALARRAGVPVLAVSETMPPGQTYQSWTLAEMAALQSALTGPAR